MPLLLGRKGGKKRKRGGRRKTATSAGRQNRAATLQRGAILKRGKKRKNRRKKDRSTYLFLSSLSLPPCFPDKRGKKGGKGKGRMMKPTSP